MYGLPTTDKEDTLIRPILAAYQTPAYLLAKFMVPILQGLVCNEYAFRNSYGFFQIMS